MKAEIISVGTELLLGSTINTDAADVAVLLSEYGIDDARASRDAEAWCRQLEDCKLLA